MIRLAELSHVYRSPLRRVPPVRALDRLSLEVEPGTLLGLIGVNGAGKTTLLRALLGYLRPAAGEVTIDGLSPRRYVERHGIGYVPERVASPRRWTVEGALRAYSLLGDVGVDGPDRVERALQRLGLAEARERRVGSLSKGTLQRLAIAQAIVCERRLLVLDEPTDGLDPVWIAELRTLLGEWRSADPQRILVLASHDLALVERVATRVVVLHAGRALADLTPGATADAGLEEAFLRLVREERRAA